MSTVKNVGAYGFSLFDEGQKIPFCPLLTHLGVALQKSLFFQQKPNLADMIFYDFLWFFFQARAMEIQFFPYRNVIFHERFNETLKWLQIQLLDFYEYLNWNCRWIYFELITSNHFVFIFDHIQMEINRIPSTDFNLNWPRTSHYTIHLVTWDINILEARFFCDMNTIFVMKKAFPPRWNECEKNS